MRAPSSLSRQVRLVSGDQISGELLLLLLQREPRADRAADTYRQGWLCP